MKFYLCLIALLAWPSPAAAYLDPGTGSMVLQIAIGGVLAALATANLYWRRLTSFFQSKSKSESAAEQSDSGSPAKRTPRD